jgi:LysR family transcriptional regulator, nod-box dependent transcriptional activator
MKHINLRRHNLNALPVLREILRHGNLTKAADALGLTQPALSNILKQLRVDFDDQLVVRRAQTMQLTPKALELAGPLDDALKSIEDVLSRSSFDPATSDRRFRIATTDFIIGRLCASLAELAMTAAPDVKIQMQAAQRSSIQQLMVGDIDMIISPTILLTAGLSTRAENDAVSSEVFMTESLVCLARGDDAEFRAGLSLEQYLARPHAGYVFGDKSLTSMEHAYLQRLGLKQHEKVLVSSYAALAPIVMRTGYLALVPLSFAKVAVAHFPLQYAAPPFEATDMEWSMVWHARQDRRADMQWLRETLKQCLHSNLHSAPPVAVHLAA